MLTRTPRRSLTDQLAERFAERIRARLLAPGARMPSVRECARQQQVSPWTVVAAYDQLIAEGYLVTRPGGTTKVHPGAVDMRPWVAAPAARVGGIAAADSSGRSAVAAPARLRGTDVRPLDHLVTVDDCKRSAEQMTRMCEHLREFGLTGIVHNHASEFRRATDDPEHTLYDLLPYDGVAYLARMGVSMETAVEMVLATWDAFAVNDREPRDCREILQRQAAARLVIQANLLAIRANRPLFGPHAVNRPRRYPAER